MEFNPTEGKEKKINKQNSQIIFFLIEKNLVTFKVL
jgi:hypothetical protein